MLGTRTHSAASAAQYTPCAEQAGLNGNSIENDDERESKRINRGTQTEVSSFEQAAALLPLAASKLYVML
jgi:hypothetical protein